MGINRGLPARMRLVCDACVPVDVDRCLAGRGTVRPTGRGQVHAALRSWRGGPSARVVAVGTFVSRADERNAWDRCSPNPRHPVSPPIMIGRLTSGATERPSRGSDT
jgi:hypothetical protein